LFHRPFNDPFHNNIFNDKIPNLKLDYGAPAFKKAEKNKQTTTAQPIKISIPAIRQQYGPPEIRQKYGPPALKTPFPSPNPKPSSSIENSLKLKNQNIFQRASASANQPLTLPQVDLLPSTSNST
jgi:hypothetical protein